MSRETYYRVITEAKEKKGLPELLGAFDDVDDATCSCSTFANEEVFGRVATLFRLLT